MSEFEVFLGIAALLFSVRFWFSWYSHLLRVNPLSSLRSERVVLATVPFLCAFGGVVALKIGGAHDVRESALWIGYYLVVGAAWIGLGMQLSELLGISVRDDVLERKNKAALWVTMCGLIALVTIYVGGNIGEGPGAVAVVASAGLATIWFFALWWIFELTTTASERIAVERDVNSGARLGGLLVVNGVILGCAAAGPWIPDDLLISFVKAAWPSLVVTGCAIAAERSQRMRTNALWTSCIYLIAAALALWRCFQ